MEDAELTLVVVNENFFEDATRVISDASAEELQTLARNSSSYLNLWRDLNLIEAKRILEVARKFGAIPYDGCKLIPSSGIWTFNINNSEVVEDALGHLEQLGSNTLQADKVRPEFISRKNPSADSAEPKYLELEGQVNENHHSKTSMSFYGEYKGYDYEDKKLKIHPPNEESFPVPDPPESGYLFLSVTGDRKRIERRLDATKKIISGTCGIFALPYLLAKKEFPVRHVRKFKPLKGATSDIFGGKPTPKQKSALDVALNTPDIALIQGPPGTGKTRVIAALQVRLAEEGAKSFFWGDTYHQFPA